MIILTNILTLLAVAFIFIYAWDIKNEFAAYKEIASNIIDAINKADFNRSINRREAQKIISEINMKIEKMEAQAKVNIAKLETEDTTQRINTEVLRDFAALINKQVDSLRQNIVEINLTLAKDGKLKLNKKTNKNKEEGEKKNDAKNI